MRLLRRSILALLSLSLLATSAFGAKEYNWEHFAGHVSGLGHLDATGTNARFLFPTGVATDSSGDVYVADTANNIIREIAPGGVVTTIAGTAGVTGTANGIGPTAEFHSPSGVAVGTDGSVYVADTGNNTIRKIAPGGIVTTLAGTPLVSGTNNGAGGLALFNSPYALALDAGGALYVADTGNNTIRKVTYLGEVSTVAGTPHVTGTANGIGAAAQFNHPTGIALDSAHARFLIADTDNDTIRELTPSGQVTTFAGTPLISGTGAGGPGIGQFNKPLGVAVVDVHHIYVADSGNETIRFLNYDGAIYPDTYGGKAHRKGSTNGKGPQSRFDDPTGIAADASGNLYVADTGNSTIREISAQANVTTYAGTPSAAGSANGTGVAAAFDFPCAIAMGPTGNLYVADTDNDVIRIVTRDGVVTKLVGKVHLSGTTNGAGGVVRFSRPAGIAVDKNGNTYVADTENDTIRLVNPAGFVTTYAGTPGVPGTTDGATGIALFNHPHGLAFDSAGNLYVADTGNDTIREIVPANGGAGTVSTLAGTPGDPALGNGFTGIGLAQFNGPEGVVSDGTNGIFVADTQNQVIRRITPAGIVSTYAGVARQRGGRDGGKEARFDSPTGITADNHHHIFVTDSLGDTIREITPDHRINISTVTTIGGTYKVISSTYGPGSAAGFGEPHGIVASVKDGTLYVADSLNDRIVKGVASGGALKVNLTPYEAVTAGAEWSVDGGPKQTSGATVHGLIPGQHTLSFTTVANFTTPANQTVTIAQDQVTVAVGNYAQEYGSVNVVITPAQAVTNGAEWKLDGQIYDPGQTISHIPAGTHNVIFTYAPGYNPPPPATITVVPNQTAYVSGTYAVRSGNLTVNLTPAGAVTAGAQWSVDSGPDEASGTTLTGLTPGSHTVYFTTATGYTAPSPEDVNIVNKATTVVTGTYTGAPIISVQQPTGTALTNGVSIVNFGSVVSGSTATLPFAIVNQGTAPLEDVSLAISGASASRFAVSGLASSTIAAGGTGTFNVSCTPIGLSTPYATLTVDSNAQNATAFSVGLTATGTNGAVNFKYGAGTYAGLISGADNTVRGYAGLTLSTKGALTGKFYLDGILSTVKGTVSTTGSYKGTPTTLSMLLTCGSGGPLNPAGYQILSGSPSNSGPVSFIAYHAAYISTQAVAEYAKYTLLMTNTNSSVSTPQGTGYATLTIARKGGAASLSGKLADGTALAYATFIASGPYGHQILIFDPALYKAKGLLSGPILFSGTNTECGGYLQWINPGLQSKTLYPNGFNTLLETDGADYIAPAAHQTPVNIFDGTFTLSYGGLSSPDPEPFTLLTTEKIVFTGSNPNKIKVTVNAPAGSFSGSFTHPVSKKSISFSGLFYQNPNDTGAAGNFVGPILEGAGVGTATTGTALSGNVQLAPAP